MAFDDMCDRAPQGEVEVVPNCFRVIQRSNWKIFLENQLDALHPSVTHQSTGRAAHEVEKIAKKAKNGRGALSYHMLSAFATVTIDKWDNFQTLNYPYGHCILTGYMGLRPQDPDTLAYDKIMLKAYGRSASRRSSASTSTMSSSIPASRCSRRCSSCARCGRSASTARSPRSGTSA